MSGYVRGGKLFNADEFREAASSKISPRAVILFSLSRQCALVPIKKRLHSAIALVDHEHPSTVDRGYYGNLVGAFHADCLAV